MDTPAAVEGTPLGLQAADPLVALLAWGFTWGLARVAMRGGASPKAAARRQKARTLIPVVAVLSATLIRAAWDVAAGEPLGLDVLGRGLGAGFAAVWGHSQFRELLKLTEPPEPVAKPADKAADKPEPRL